jgi:hypothetical protein
LLNSAAGACEGDCAKKYNFIVKLIVGSYNDAIKDCERNYPPNTDERQKCIDEAAAAMNQELAGAYEQYEDCIASCRRNA